MSQLNMENVSIRLGQETVVHEVSAKLHAGKLYILVGPNGAGKTTLLKALASLIPTQMGRIDFDGQDMAGLSPPRRAEIMAYLPQDRSIAWDLSCVEVAALGAQHL
ncbi:MAG: ABC transporter ATP-binding protein, partial [Asticcacaulis sp.]